MTQTMQPATLSGAQQQGMPTYEISDEDRKRQERIADARKAYDGELDPPLKKMPDGTDPNVLTNRIQPFVDAGVNFLFGQELEISCGEDSPQEAQDCIDGCWGRKEQRIPLLQDLAYNGAIAGSPFLRIVPDDKGNFRLVAIDPSIVAGMQTAPQDCDTVLLFCIQYSQSEKDQAGKPQEIFYREEIMRIDPDGNASKGMPDDDDTWQIQHWTAEGRPGMQPRQLNWKAEGDPILWPYPFPPLFKCKNLPNPNNAWGKPDITPDIIGVNKAINMLQSSIQIIEILYGQPFLYGKGISESSLDRNPGRIAIVGPDGEIVAVNITSDVANGLVFLDNLRSDMDEQSHFPGIATGRLKDMPRGNVSGVALQLLFLSALKKTDGKRCRYGELIIEASKALLVLNHMSEDVDITLAWQEPLPHDDLQSLQAAILKKQIGISDTTIQREQGYDPDEELELSQNEDAQKLAAFSKGMGMPPAQPGMPPQPPMPGMQQPGQGQESPFLGRQ